MILSYTGNAAYQLFRENEIGSLKEGMNADLVVLSENIYESNKEDIRKIKCVCTLSNGKIVYRNVKSGN